jgi:hypothetical protein
MNYRYVKAVFKGLDKSCGFDTGYEYEICIIVNPDSQEVNIQTDEATPGKCVYSSILTFLDNWDNIRNYCM